MNDYITRSCLHCCRAAAVVMAFAFGISPSELTLRAQLPTAELHSLSRQVLQPGTTGEISLQGSRLDESSRLAIYDMNGGMVSANVVPRLAPLQPLRDDRQATTTFDCSIDSAVAPGLYEVRSTGRFGISNPRYLLISGLAVDIPSSGHNNLVTAHLVKQDHLINDKTTERSTNYYRCDLKPGQRLRCVAYCKQLDSLAELSLRLLNKDGQLISSSRTSGNWPAELAWTSSASEEQPVFVEVRDLLYRGGPNYNFVIEFKMDPVETIATASALHLDLLLRPTLDLPLNISKLSQPAGAAYIQRGWTEATAVPANAIEQFPVRIKGDLQQTRVISFTAQKDQSLSFEVASASLDQLTDPAIVVYKVLPPKPDGSQQLQQVVEQDDAAFLGTPAVRIRRTDPLLVWKVPETTNYQLHIIDRQAGQRPLDSRGFVLEIRPVQPGFALVAHEPYPTNNPATSKPWGGQLLRNGTMQLHVSVIRYDGLSEPIELRVEGLPTNCHCPPVLVPAGGVEADLVVQAIGDIDGSLQNIAIVGAAKVGENTLTSRASLAVVSSATIPTRNAITSRLASSIPLQLVNVDTAPLQLQLGEGSLLEAKAGSKFNLPVKLSRQTGSAAECTLRPQSLPPKVGLGEFKIAADKSDAAPEVNVPADAPTGEYTFWVQAETKVKWRANPQQLVREEAYAAKLKSALEANSIADVPRPQVEAALTQANARIEELKKATAEQEYTLFLPSSPIRIRILPKD